MVRWAAPWPLRGAHSACQSVVLCLFSPGQDGKLFFMACLRRGPSAICFFWCVFACALFFSLKAGADGDPPGLAQGNKVGRHGMPRTISKYLKHGSEDGCHTLCFLDHVSPLKGRPATCRGATNTKSWDDIIPCDTWMVLKNVPRF